MPKLQLWYVTNKKNYGEKDGVKSVDVIFERR